MLAHITDDLQMLARHTLSYLGDLQSKKIVIDGETFTCLTGGNGPVLLFLHGLAGSKTQWRTVMQQLARDYHVIAVDIPGFCMQQLSAPHYRNVRDMLAWLQRFTDAMELTEYHLMAACSGAVIGFQHALQRPDCVTSFTAVGLPDFQNRANLQDMLEDFLVSVPEDIDHLLQRLFYRAPAIPGVIKRYYLHEARKLQPDTRKRLEDLINTLPVLVPKLRTLTLPVALISGTVDPFSTPESLHFAQNSLGGPTRLYTIPQCGHLPYLEKPDQLVKHFHEFQEARQAMS